MTTHENQLCSQWQKGQSGNPKGKPKGARNKATLMALAVLEKDVEAIANKVVDAALGGDLQAARFILERLIPPAKERPIHVKLPDIENILAINLAHQEIMMLVGQGDLLLTEATILSNLLEQKRKAIETQELEQRIANLEAKK